MLYYFHFSFFIRPLNQFDINIINLFIICLIYYVIKLWCTIKTSRLHEGLLFVALCFFCYDFGASHSSSSPLFPSNYWHLCFSLFMHTCGSCMCDYEIRLIWICMNVQIILDLYKFFMKTMGVHSCKDKDFVVKYQRKSFNIKKKEFIISDDSMLMFT